MKRAPILLHSPQELREWRKSAPGRVGFVPTMGALHAGHADLLKRMRAACDQSVLSIFVNPAQFGPKEDLSKYPRTLESDMKIAQECGVDAVFFPTPEQMYPAGYSTYVNEESLTSRLCGEFRPSHFRGVTTVVLKLFNLVRPELAFFGMKDAQQFFILHKMARDLNLEVSVEGVPTVRETDGLALSSRNVYLSAEERAKAPAIYLALKTAASQIEQGEPIEQCLGGSLARLDQQGFRVQYLECLRLPELTTPTEASALPKQAYLIAIAAHLGNTRLIDNVILHADTLASQGISLRSEKH